MQLMVLGKKASKPQAVYALSRYCAGQKEATRLCNTVQGIIEG